MARIRSKESRALEKQQQSSAPICQVLDLSFVDCSTYLALSFGLAK